MADKNKDPKELMDIAAQQGTHAAKNVAAAASEVISDVLPKDTEGIALLVRVSNKTLLVAAVSATAVATAAVVTRFQKERALKVQAEKNGSGNVQYKRMPEPSITPVVVEPTE
jgi:hypothetical protein